jgi:hypothetical protein
VVDVGQGNVGYGEIEVRHRGDEDQRDEDDRPGLGAGPVHPDRCRATRRTIGHGSFAGTRVGPVVGILMGTPISATSFGHGHVILASPAMDETA